MDQYRIQREGGWIINTPSRFMPQKPELSASRALSQPGLPFYVYLVEEGGLHAGRQMTTVVLNVSCFFYRKFAEFDEIMHSDPESLKNIISKVLTWLIRTRWRRAIWGTLSVIKCKFGSIKVLFGGLYFINYGTRIS